MTECRETLSAYVPIRAPARAVADFDLPLKVYIIETVEYQARMKRLRQFGIVAVLVVGMFVFQWPVAFSSANAVPNLPISAAEAGARTSVVVVPERLAFAAALGEHY